MDAQNKFLLEKIRIMAKQVEDNLKKKRKKKRRKSEKKLINQQDNVLID